MRLPIKMYLVIVIGAFLVLYQYHLSKVWLLRNSQVPQEVDILMVSSTTSDIDDRKLNASKIDSEQNDRYKITMLANPPHKFVNNLPILYIITPTYRRPEQIPELTRLSHTLMLVPNIYWLVIEDAETPTPQVTEVLNKTGLKFQHLIAPMPEVYKKSKGAKPRGVSNRMRGLQWLRKNAKDGVFYFADDDNTYDLELFEEMRNTERVSMWPVGLITKMGVSSPILENGNFIGFYDGWIAGRKFPVDMASFAVSVKFLLSRTNAAMPFKPGFEEDGFLKSLAPLEPVDIEFRASNCTKILVWHTQTKKNEPATPLDVKKYSKTNLIRLKKILV